MNFNWIEADTLSKYSRGYDAGDYKVRTYKYLNTGNWRAYYKGNYFVPGAGNWYNTCEEAKTACENHYKEMGGTIVKETDSDNIVYKALILKDDGRMVSYFAGGKELYDLIESAKAAPELEYNLGEITYTPAGGKGIYVLSSFDIAKGFIESYGYMKKSGRAIIVKAKALGNEMNDARGTYPAIIPIEIVWEGEEAKPVYKPVYENVDITDECDIRLKNTGEKNCMNMEISHDGEYLWLMSVSTSIWNGTYSHGDYTCKLFHDKGWLNMTVTKRVQVN